MTKIADNSEKDPIDWVASNLINVADDIDEPVVDAKIIRDAMLNEPFED